ncbi:hypothetical protein [Marinagarivorans algicola]|uniref:hypothetical protein n=1 Tax=Marinagarivorans algicola TaxID=1513270 RepID=UPI0006B52838|nr:hypothetical protein [Marinagarivorans algicola]
MATKTTPYNPANIHHVMSVFNMGMHWFLEPKNEHPRTGTINHMVTNKVFKVEESLELTEWKKHATQSYIEGFIPRSFGDLDPTNDDHTRSLMVIGCSDLKGLLAGKPTHAATKGTKFRLPLRTAPCELNHSVNRLVQEAQLLQKEAGANSSRPD